MTIGNAWQRLFRPSVLWPVLFWFVCVSTATGGATAIQAADKVAAEAGPSLSAPNAEQPADAKSPAQSDQSKPSAQPDQSKLPAQADQSKPPAQSDQSKPAVQADQSKPPAQADQPPPVDSPAAEQGGKKPAPAGAEATLEGRQDPNGQRSEPLHQPAPEHKASLGEPLAPEIMELMVQEIKAGLRLRHIEDNFARFENYAGYKLNSSAGPYTGSELMGNCRLSWYDHLLRNPLKAPIEAEAFTRNLHKAAIGDHRGLAEVLATAAEKLDLSKRRPRSFPRVTSPQQALETLKHALCDAQIAYAAALAPLAKSEIQELQRYLYPVMVGQNNTGHTLADRNTGRRLCDLLEKMDRDSMVAAGEALVPLADPELLEQLKSLSFAGEITVEGVTGTVLAKIDTPAGAIVIGGKGNNTYQLDRMPGVAAVIDLGGDDLYLEGTVSPERPVLVIIDLAGNDTYRARQPGVQGGAILGVSMLLDLSGDDVYEAVDVAQGSAVAGVGILIDYAGNDIYHGLRRVQGQALGGVGILIDRAGNDSYHAAMWAQGMGGPLGFALLEDIEGNDHYYCGGLYPDSYLSIGDNPTPGYEGFGQGVGAGLRQVANGGIGVILDGGGDDVYEFDYLSHGGGYWCGVGFARDFAGNDQYLITRKAYNGGPRTQRSFGRFGCGYGCHYALGFCFDDAGDDVYEGTIMSLGFAWDCAVGVLCDFAGNDRYEATGGGTQGNGAQAGLGILFDYDGNDTYLGYGQGYASPGISYHDLPHCGGNFSFLIDWGGTDKYGCGAENNSYNQRGSAGGFLIDRPKAHEVPKPAQTAEAADNSGAAQPQASVDRTAGTAVSARPDRRPRNGDGNADRP